MLNGGTRETFLDKYVKNYGAINYITPNDIKNNAVRIFRDFAYGNFDSAKLEKYRDFFMDNTTIENLKIVAQIKWHEAHNVELAALLKYEELLPPDQKGTDWIRLNKIERWQKLGDIYKFFMDQLDMFQSNKDFRILIGLSSYFLSYPSNFKEIRKYIQ